MSERKVVKVEVDGDEDGAEGYFWIVMPEGLHDVTDHLGDAVLLEATPEGCGPFEPMDALVLDGAAEPEAYNSEALRRIADKIRRVLDAGKGES